MKRKKWIVKKGNKELAQEVSEELGIESLAAYIATTRGMEYFFDLEEFFDEDTSLTIDPFSIKDMDKASEILKDYAIDGKLICVYGDYDADGVTATALLYSYLIARDANVIYYIPDRVSEGYGLNNAAIDLLKEKGVELIVTVDNGVSAVDEVKYAYSLGMKVIVTDHHKVGDVMPDCEAVVDPHRPDCESDFKDLSGVGVAFELACATDGCNEDLNLDDYCELLAIGTIGDVVPLKGENRIFVKKGIEKIAHNPSFGIEALIEASGIKNKPFNSLSAAYTICPRINAAGRMSSATKALELLLAGNEYDASNLASEINSLNSQRQVIENEIYNSALEIIASDKRIANDSVIVVSGDDWHQGVVGIVAAKLTEHFGKPSIVISCSNGEGKGSCRSVEGFSIYDAVESVSDCLTHFGGHTLAAGVGMNSDKIDEFRRRINEYASQMEMPVQTQSIDVRMNPRNICVDLIDAVSQLEPFGAGNPQPVFGLFGVMIEEITPVSEGKHLRLNLSHDGYYFTAMYFGMQESKFPYTAGDMIDVACHLERNVFNGELRVTVIVKDIRYSYLSETKILDYTRIFDRFIRFGELSKEEAVNMLPDRQSEIDIYKAIKNKPLKDKSIESLCIRLNDDGGKYSKFAAIVEIMTEMGILVCDKDNKISVPASSIKVDLENSDILKSIRKIAE